MTDTERRMDGSTAMELSLPAGAGSWTSPSGFANSTGTDQVCFLTTVGGVETVYDTTSHTLGRTQTERRIGDRSSIALSAPYGQ